MTTLHCSLIRWSSGSAEDQVNLEGQQPEMKTRRESGLTGIVVEDAIVVHSDAVGSSPFREGQAQHHLVVLGSWTARSSFLTHQTGIAAHFDLAQHVAQVDQSNDPHFGHILLTTGIHFPLLVGRAGCLWSGLGQLTMSLIGTRPALFFQKARNARQRRQPPPFEAPVRLQLGVQGFRSPPGMGHSPVPQCLTEQRWIGTQGTGCRAAHRRGQSFAPMPLCPATPLPYSLDFPTHLDGNLRIRIPQSSQLVNGGSVLQSRYSCHIPSPFYHIYTTRERMPQSHRFVKTESDTTLLDF